MTRGDVQLWLETELGQQEFKRTLEGLLGPRERQLLLRWASRREHLSQAEIDHIEPLGRMLGALLERWEVVGAEAAPRYVAKQGELGLV